MSKHVFTVKDGVTCLDGQKLLVKGLRCSNALYSDKTADELIENLEQFAYYGVNAVSVFFMGSRFGNIKGYREDAQLDGIYSRRMDRIIRACDEKGMITLVGCLYWGESESKYESWTQSEADLAVANTIRWLGENDHRNVLVDVDNEGMARKKGFDNRLLVMAGKSVDATYVIGTNYKGLPPAEADISLHFSYKADKKPYIESEGVPENAPGAYWGHYSRRIDPVNKYKHDESYKNYLNIGIYTEDMKMDQMEFTKNHLDRGDGYMLASTWLQCVEPYGPNHNPGGYGSPEDPGIKWWLEFLKERWGSL